MDTFVAFALQLGVVWEIAYVVMRPTGTWVRDAKRQFILWSAAGILFAATLPWLVTPPGKSILVNAVVRTDLFTCIVACELVTVLMFTSNRLGLGWRNHVMALGNGIGFLSIVGVVLDGLHGYYGLRHYHEIEQIGLFLALGMAIYWAFQFWQEEPARKPISPELRAYIEALHERVKNNLDTLGAQG
ncbi:MAG: hypothetical protein ABR907_05710 [Terracidiphilus sp.]